MKTILALASSRSAQVVAVSAAVLTVLREFGVPLTDSQEGAVNTLLFALIALLAGRDVKAARGGAE